MTTLLWIAAALGVVIGALLIIAALRPDRFRLERSITINAPPETVLVLIDNFHEWTRWSPFEESDANLTRRYEGAASGPGAIYEWRGKKSGSGRMEILGASHAHVRIKLDFLKPFEAQNIADFTAVPGPDGTKLTWAMHGPQPFVGRLMTMFFSTEKIVGGEFEKGLASLKSVAEAQSNQQANDEGIQ